MLALSLQVPSRYAYLITQELIEQAAELLRTGRRFDLHIDEESLGHGFDAIRNDGIGELPGVTSTGISAAGLITLVPRSQSEQDNG